MQARFVRAMRSGVGQREAARAAGYRWPADLGYRLLRKAHIVDALKKAGVDLHPHATRAAHQLAPMLHPSFDPAADRVHRSRAELLRRPRVRARLREILTKAFEGVSHD
jgi:hypothetical protein